MTRFLTLATGLEFPEGPSVAADGAIWLSELKGGRIARVNSDGGIARFAVGGTPNGTAIARDGTIWFCDAAANAVRQLDPASGDTAVVVDAVDGAPLAAPNDLAFHANGDLVFTCPGDSRVKPTGYLCRRGVDGSVRRIADGLRFPNGICFSAVGERLFVAETYACRVMSAGWSDTPDLQPELATPGPIGADGVAVAADGTVHATVYGAGIVRTRRPDGSVTDTVVPDPHPAGCAVDPLSRWDLLVTGSATGVLLGMAA